SPPLGIDAITVVSTLLLAQFLPMCIGLAVRKWRPAWADKLRKPANTISMFLNLTLLTLILYVQQDMLLGLPLRAVFGMLPLVLAAVAAGWLLGMPGAANRTAMTMATAVRNVGVSLVIATGSFAGTEAVTSTTAFGIFQTLVMTLIALVWGRVASRPAL